MKKEDSEFLKKITHDMNNAMCVITLETETLMNDALHRKVNDLVSMIRELQLFLSRNN